MIRQFILLCTSVVVGSIGFAANSYAATSFQCKGQVENICTSSTDCRWVDSYVRKDGKTVKAHCKKQSKKKLKQQPVAPKKAQLNGKSQTKKSITKASKKK